MTGTQSLWIPDRHTVTVDPISVLRGLSVLGPSLKAGDIVKRQSRCRSHPKWFKERPFLYENHMA